MGQRIIDLTLTMENSSAWVQFPRRLLYDHEAEEPATRIVEFFNHKEKEGWWSSIYRFETTTQSFTHMSSPKHFHRETGIPIDEYPLERLIGNAVVINLSHKKPKEIISATDLEEYAPQINPKDIVIIRTDWTERAWGTKRFFSEMIGMSHDAADWLLSKDIKALAIDCRTDIPPFKECDCCGTLIKNPEQNQNRLKFLERNIPVIDFCTNIQSLSKDRVFFVCLPLKLKGADGSPVRVIAIEEEP